MRIRSKHGLSALLFVSPAVLLMIIILVVPIGIAAFLSFSAYGLGNSEIKWVGFDNYEKIFTRSSYRKMFVASFTYVAIVVPGSVALGLATAMLINSLRFGKALYKTIYFLPVMATLLAMAIAWQFTLHPTIGVINKFLEAGCDNRFVFGLFSGGWLPGYDSAQSWYATGCDDSFPLWLGDKKYAIWTLCFIGIWQAVGFNMVLYLAGLASIPRQLYDAAEMDGASSTWEQFRLVTWPMLGPTSVFVVTITSIRSFQVFDTVEALTHGGPAKSTYVMMYAIFEKAIRQNLVGLGAALTIVFLVFILMITIFQRYLVERRVHYS
jgi:multiple sugar transport system permease protein